MSNKATEFKFIPTLIIGSVLAGLALTGCARDGSRNRFSNFLASPSDQFAAAQRDVEKIAPPSVIQQTSFEGKVASPVWYESYSDAVAEAEKNDKLILADFTGSDWCHWCVKLKQDIFEAPEFKAWASENVVLLELDYPKNGSQSPSIKEQNAMLKSRYNISSYPTVLLLDAAGNVRAKMGYERGKSPSQWVQVAEARLQENAMKVRSTATGNSDSTIR